MMEAKSSFGSLSLWYIFHSMKSITTFAESFPITETRHSCFLVENYRISLNLFREFKLFESMASLALMHESHMQMGSDWSSVLLWGI